MRYYGAYANRARRLFREAAEEENGRRAGGRDLDPAADAEDELGFAKERRKSWARLLRPAGFRGPL